MNKIIHLLSSKKLTFLIMMFLLVAVVFAQTPQYYNYNTTGNANSFPFNQPLGKMCQWLVAPTEFNTPAPAPGGNITNFYCMMAAALGPYTYTNFYILFGQTTLTSLPTGSIYTGAMDTVYKRASVQLTGTLGNWLAFTLDHPFLYDPSQSLIIQIEQCGCPGATGFSLAHTNLTGNRRTYSLTNSPCPWGYQGQGVNVINCGIDVAPATINCTYAWGTQTSGTTNLLQAVSAVNGNVCWVAGATATVRVTTNAGATWNNGNSTPGVITGDIYNIAAYDANNAWVTTSPTATFIYRTTNGGALWTQVFTQAGGFIDAMMYTSATNGFAYGDPVGSRWSLWKTTNGGLNWDSTGLYLPQAGTEAGWNNAMSIVGSNIWFGTNNTRVYHSTNGGVTGSWTPGTTTGNVSTYGVWFGTATNGMTVGTIVQVSTNGGTTWTNGGAPGGTGNETSVGGAGSNFWLTRGNNVYGSTDFGTTWAGAGYTGTQALWGTSITTGTNGCLTGWSVGAGGTVVKLTGTPVGITNNNNEIPKVYSLEQNYPNPFNPTTKITYALPKAGNVELRIYDMLGREVSTLVNEFTSAGKHTVEFNANNLASGVYFYKIISGDFKDTKKMMLVK